MENGRKRWSDFDPNSVCVHTRARAEVEGSVELSRPYKASFSLYSVKGKLQLQSASDLPGVRKAALP